MRLGLIADIHEDVERLQRALTCLEREQVDQVVVLGDIAENGSRLDETCRLLRDASAVGVWGNHDFGLCFDPDELVRKKYSSAVLAYMSSLRPRLDVGGCHFMHIEPWLNPEDLLDLWFFDVPPDSSERLCRIFAAVPHRILFGGHYHRWLLVTPDGIDGWTGQQPIRLDNGRYFVVVHALCLGSFAIFDTVTSTLSPFNDV